MEGLDRNSGTPTEEAHDWGRLCARGDVQQARDLVVDVDIVRPDNLGDPVEDLPVGCRALIPSPVSQRPVPVVFLTRRFKVEDEAPEVTAVQPDKPLPEAVSHIGDTVRHDERIRLPHEGDCVLVDGVAKEDGLDHAS